MDLDLQIFRQIYLQLFGKNCDEINLDYYRAAFHKVINSSSPEFRETTAESIVPLIRKILEENKIPQKDREPDPLKNVGILPLGKLFTYKQIIEIKNHLAQCPVYNRHVWGISDKVGRTVEETKKSFPQGSYLLSDTLRCPHVLETILSDRIIHLVEGYLGCTPTLYSANFMYNFPNTLGKQIGTQHFHRDLDNFRFVTLFVFITDINEQTGIHQHISGTHLSSHNGDIVSVIGEAGEGFISDPFGLHRGLPTMNGERLIFWARYGLYDNGYSADVTPYPLRMELLEDRKTHYIVRPLIETEFTSPHPKPLTFS